MKFSIVTPVYNGERYIAKTIESVLSQEGDFEIEYIVKDGSSSDDTLKILKKYDNLLKESKFAVKCGGISFKWTSEKDNGMYDAINKGFSEATGNIFAWINSDDFYLPGAFSKISLVFDVYPKIMWLKGITSILDNEKLTNQSCWLFNQNWIEKGMYGRFLYFINQDSVFWKKELWQKAGPIKLGLKLSGDYYLWTNMAKYSPLLSLNSEVSCYRRLKESLGQSNMEKYRKEQELIVPIKHDSLEYKIKLLYFLVNITKNIIPSVIFELISKYIFPRISMSYFDIDKSGKITEKQSYFFEVKNNL